MAMDKKPVRLQMVWPELNEGWTYTDALVLDKRKKQLPSLLEFYSTKHASTGSKEQWQARITSGQIRVNGRPVLSCSHVLSHGDQLAYERLPWKESSCPNYVDVLYEDEHLVAVDKPSGLQVLPAAMQLHRTVLTLLKLRYQPGVASQESRALAAADDDDATHPVPVHRLGRGTSGLLLCAVSAAAKRNLADVMTHTTLADAQVSAAPHTQIPQPQLQEGCQRLSWPAQHTQGCAVFDASCVPDLPVRAVRKMYRTRVQGLVETDQGEVCAPIGRMPYPGVRGGLYAACSPGDPAGKASRSRWTVVHRDAATQTTLLNVEIFTGRPHQIRIHMAVLGHPLLGDPLYVAGGTLAAAGGTPAAGVWQETTGVDSRAPALDGLAAPPSLHHSTQLSGGGTTCASSPSVAPTPHELQQGCAGAGHEVPGAAGAELDARPEVAVPGDGGYLLHSWQLLLHHPVIQDKVIQLVAPLPAELAAPWEQ